STSPSRQVKIDCPCMRPTGSSVGRKLQSRTAKCQSKPEPDQESEMKKLIISGFTICTVVFTMPTAHAGWVCEQFCCTWVPQCSDFKRMKDGCSADHDDTRVPQERLH